MWTTREEATFKGEDFDMKEEDYILEEKGITGSFDIIFFWRVLKFLIYLFLSFISTSHFLKYYKGKGGKGWVGWG